MPDDGSESLHEIDWMPGCSNEFLLAFAMFVANEEELAGIVKALEKGDTE